MSTHLRQFLFDVSGRLRLRIVNSQPENNLTAPQTEWTPLFERYHVCTAPAWLGGWTVYIHHYLRSDPDPAPHDHPNRWSIAIPLVAGYWEIRPKRISEHGLIRTSRWRRPFVPYFLSGDHYHRVVCATGTTSWSLFLRGPRNKSWGFLRETRVPSANSDISASIFPKQVYYDVVRQNDKELEESWHHTNPYGYQQKRAAP